MRDRILRAWTAETRAGVLSGGLVALAAPPAPFGLLGYVALLPLLSLVFDPARLRSGRPIEWRPLILSFGLTRHLLSLHWLVMLGEASPLTFKWALPFMLLLLAFYATVYDAVVLVLLARLRRGQGQQAIWWVPGLWVLGEWLRGFGEMGFPWLGLATTQLAFLPVLQLASLLGELGVTLFVVWVNVLLALAWISWRGGFPRLGRAVLGRTWAPVTLVLLVVSVVLFGLRSMAEIEESQRQAPSLAVAGIQANVDLLDKWDPAKRDSTFVPYTTMTEAAAAEGARLVVWPETAMPFDLPRRAEEFAWARELARANGVFLYTGFVERQVDDAGRLDSFNSSLMLSDQGVVVARYRKMHLLPLGERMPFQGILPVLGRIDFGQAEWTPGRERTVFDVDGHAFSALICFESIFSRFSRDAVREGAGMLINVTNDGWFGRTVLPRQHAAMSVLRACENRVPLVRVANNGVSFVVRPSGRVDHATGLFERALFVAEVTPRPGGTFYTRHGDRVVLGLIGLGMAFLVLVARVARPDAR